MRTTRGARRTVPFQLVILAGAFAAGTALARPQKSVAVSFTVPESVLTLHEPLFVDFSVRNQLSEGITFNLGFNRERNFRFAIVQRDGSKVQISPLEEGGFGAVGEVSVAPGETYTQKLLLNKWHQFVEPGTYKIQASLAGSIQTRSGAPVEASLSQELPLRIEPRDATRLDEVCHKLADIAAQESDVEIAGNAVFALAYVQDLIAVPYLGQVARNQQVLPFKQVAIQGLGRIAYSEGIGPVMARLNPRDPRLDSAVKAALRCIQLGCQVLD